MATRNFNWPASTVSATNPSVGVTGTGAPASATEIGGVDSNGDLQAVAVNPDGSLIIDTNLNKNYGAVGANTLRTAAQIGSATGAANFGSGATGGQTLRVEANQGAANATPWNVLATAGTAIIGKVGIDQTTPGTTNGVQVNAALPAGANIIGKVSIDQTTPGTTNAVAITGTVPLPTGAATSALQTTGNTSLATIATNTGKTPVNATGTYAEITNLTNSAQTFTAPAGAVGFILEALSDNTANVRYKIGAAATTTSGMRLEPGRDSGYLPLGANISVICETAATNQVVTVQWVSP